MAKNKRSKKLGLEQGINLKGTAFFAVEALPGNFLPEVKQRSLL